MTNYLSTLIAQARGEGADIRPRLRGRFEPEGSAGLTIVETEIEAPARVVPQKSQAGPPTPPAERSQPRGLAPGIVVQEAERAPPGQVRDLRVEREKVVERRDAVVERVEKLVQHVERVESVGKIVSAPVEPRASTPTTDAAPKVQPAVERPAPPAPNPLPAPPAPGREPQEAGDAPRIVPVEPIAARATTIRPAAAREIERRRAPAPEAAPEIAISIGVLDIRLTRDEDARPRPAPARPAPSAEPLALADYLAKRTEGA